MTLARQAATKRGAPILGTAAPRPFGRRECFPNITGLRTRCALEGRNPENLRGLRKFLRSKRGFCPRFRRRPRYTWFMDFALRDVTIFAGLDDTALALLMERASERIAPAGTVILREGEPGNHLYLIASGSVRVCKRFDRTDELELARLKAGDFFGEMCILETLPRTATVLTRSDAILHALPSVAFYELFKEKPDQYGILILNIARDVSRRLRRLDEIFAARH